MENYLFKACSFVRKRALIMIMKTFIFFLCTTVFSFNTTNSFSQEKVLIDHDRLVTVDQVFKIIKEQTNYRFIYPKLAFKDSPKVQLKKGEIKLVKLLKKSLLNNDLSFELTEDNNIRIKKNVLISSIEKQQEVTISGTVKDETGMPLPGASIVEKGTTNGTTTDFDGNYELSIKGENTILVISYVGYISKEVVLGDQINVNIQLDPDNDLDEVVIVGYKAQAQEVIRAKKKTVQIADFLSQANIGRLPDFAAADAARRIVGVNTVFEEDEATQVGLRGLPPIYTFATIDGLSIPSADRNTRVANFEVIPSSSVSRIEVYKSRTANLDGNAIGGVFNLRTKSAYDSEDRVITASTSFGVYDFNDVPRSSRNNASKNGISNRTDFTFADQFGKNNQFGIVFSGSYNRKDRDELKSPRANYKFVNDDETKPIPNRLRINAYDNIINRYGGFLKFEYKPNDKFFASLSGSLFNKEDSEIRYESRIDNLVFDNATLTPTGGNFTAGRSRLAHNIFEIEHKLSNFIFDSYYKFNEKSKIDFKFGAAKGFRGEDGPGAEYRTGDDTEISGTFSVNSDRLFYQFNDDAFYSNPANYALKSISGFTRSDDEDFTSASINYGYNMEDDSEGWGVKAGYKFRVLNHLFDQDALSLDYTGSGDLALNQFILDEPFQPGVLGQQFPLFDPYALIDFIGNNSSSFTLPADALGTKFGRGIVDQPQNEFDIKETINAVYGMVGYRGEKFQFFGGLRYEDTKTKTTRPINVNGVYDGTRSKNNNDFGHLLPSASLIYDFAEKVKFKAAFSKAIGRADYGQLAPVEFNDVANDQITRGNPNLKPRTSSNFDASLEYYFEGGSLFSIGFFHKNIKDDIQTESTFEGTTEIFTPTNIDGFAVTGIELNFVKNDFDFLPGFLSNFGTSSNYSFIVGERFLNDGRRLASIVNLPRHSINAQLYYQTKKWDSRLAWNWVDQTLSSIRTGQEFNNRYLAARHQLDWTGNVKVSKTLSVFAEVRNLTNANRTFLGGPDQSLVEEVTEYGKSFWLGLNYNF